MKSHNATVLSYFLPVRMDDPVSNYDGLQGRRESFLGEPVGSLSEVKELLREPVDLWYSLEDCKGAGRAL